MKLVRAKEGYRKVGDKYLLAKKCTKCGKWKVASTDNFHREKKGKYGLTAQCKECKAIRAKQYREANKDRIAERNKQWYEANKEQQKQYYQDNKEKILERHKQYYQDNKDKIDERHKRYYENNKEKILEYQKQWKEDNRDKMTEYYKQYRDTNKEKIAEQKRQYYDANKEKLLEYHKQYREVNKDRIAERDKKYYEANKDKIAEYKKQWSKQYYQTPQGQVVRFNASNKRRHKKAAQGTGATPDQWLEMMQYFDWRCAYTGERLTDKTRSGDHIVPIDAGGDDMVWNMVPMLRNLNSSKRAKDMLEWYRKQDFYSEARLAKIYEWQEYAYNKWGKDTEYFNTNDIQITLL